MGFAGRVVPLSWPDPGHALHGMEIAIRPPSVAALDEIQEGQREGETPAQTSLRRLALIASHVVSWNLEHPTTGEPLEKTAEGLHAFDAGAVIEILDEWSDHGRVPPPSKSEDPKAGGSREPVDPLDVTSEPGLPMGASSAVEALIHTQDAR